MPKDLEEKFKLHCESESLEVNQNQIKVIKKLQNYFNQNFTSSLLKTLFVKNSKKAFYLHGGVGVGKTMILNFFFDLINQEKKDFTLMSLCWSFTIMYTVKNIKIKRT